MGPLKELYSPICLKLSLKLFVKVGGGWSQEVNLRLWGNSIFQAEKKYNAMT